MGASLLALAKSLYYSQYYGLAPKSSADKVIILSPLGFWHLVNKPKKNENIN